MNQQEIQVLFIKGDRALDTGDYVQAVALFEQLSQTIDANSPNYFHIQRGLVKAYYQNQAVDKAISLCEQIIANSSSGNRLWGEQFLATITGESMVETLLPPEPEPKKINFPNTIKLKSLAEFKNYCQDNLLPQLKELEKQRIIALVSIVFSGIICIFLSVVISLWVTYFLIFKSLFYICFSKVLICLFPLWLMYCRACIRVYRLGFKRKIIEKIFDFIDANNTLEYAPHLFIEDKHHTAICFGRSQLFSRSTEVPDFLAQEDCVFGKIDKTNIFFAEILVERMSSAIDLNQYQQYMPEATSKNPGNKIFKGLFFIAKFPKNFENRTFILPNNFRNKITPQSWRGQIINLEDSEFNRMFYVYGDSQLESRYILSTSLMNRLVQFQKKAHRNVYISFIEGHVCIAMRYSHHLFEPKLFTSMLSFAPLREYFENLQLMIGIVQDLNLNQKIWQP